MSISKELCYITSHFTVSMVSLNQPQWVIKVSRIHPLAIIKVCTTIQWLLRCFALHQVLNWLADLATPGAILLVLLEKNQTKARTSIIFSGFGNLPPHPQKKLHSCLLHHLLNLVLGPFVDILIHTVNELWNAELSDMVVTSKILGWIKATSSQIRTISKIDSWMENNSNVKVSKVSKKVQVAWGLLHSIFIIYFTL